MHCDFYCNIDRCQVYEQLNLVKNDEDDGAEDGNAEEDNHGVANNVDNIFDGNIDSISVLDQHTS